MIRFEDVTFFYQAGKPVLRDFSLEIPDGGRILLQKAVEVMPGDTPEILQRRVMEQAEWKILPETIDRIARGEIAIGDVSGGES